MVASGSMPKLRQLESEGLVKRTPRANDRRAFTRHIWNEWFVAYKPDAAEFERTAIAFDNPDWADIVLHSYLQDTERAMVLDSTGQYSRPIRGAGAFDSHQFLLQHYTESGND